MRYLFLCVFIFALCISCGKGNSVKTSIKTPGTKASINTRIINGVEVSQDASPQLVEIHIQYNDGSSGLCTGSVIGKNSVLTAAHCVAEDISRITVSTSSQTFEPRAIHIAPGYYIDQTNQALFNDLAVIKTNRLKVPALAILSSHLIEAGTQLTTYGFGINEEGIAGILRAGTTTIEISTENHLFATEYNGQESNSCSGDSGGPAILSLESQGLALSGIVGVVSSGTSSDCQAGDQTLYTNVQNQELINFIASVVPDLLIK